ncbi:MAG: hypothetical protein LKE59_11970 [Eubacterium sp.]|jgi:hypothetical protein|nr:hypothetical protein [Eubacterium sp.]MCH4078870.1 hypothetical protein [Eubacterium sp.]
MVVKTKFNEQYFFLHAAWADDEAGTNLSLKESNDALFIGRYTDQSSEESTDPAKYSWQEIEPAEENDPGTFEDLEDRLEELEDAADDLSADAEINSMDITLTQGNTDTEIGNVNLLVSTNQGVTGWSASSNLTLSENEEGIYTDLDTVNYLTVTCTTAGENSLSFFAADLRNVLSSQPEGNSYTLSADIRMSELFTIPVRMQDSDGSNIQIAFSDIDNTAAGEDTDNSGVWIHYSSTALSLGVAASSQNLSFDLSAMPSGSTLDIANLKVEEGALATPWRESLSEINAKADAAKQAADAAQQTADSLDSSVTGLQEDVYGDGGITETITGLVGETKTVTDEAGEVIYDEITYTDSDRTSHTEKVARTERIPGRLDELDSKVQDAADQAKQAIDGQEKLSSMKSSVDEAKEILKEWSLDDGSGTIDGSKIGKGTITSEKIAAGALLISSFSQEALSLINQPLKYIRSAEVDGELVIEIGEEGSPYKVTISKQGMSLYAGGAISAFFNTDTMKITKARILESIRFGSAGDNKDDFAFVPQPNGNLSFKLLEDQEG